MKRRRPARLAPAPLQSATLRTGEHCPMTGWWYPLQSESAPAPTPRFVGQGSVMPAVGGTPSFWLPSQSS